MDPRSVLSVPGIHCPFLSTRQPLFFSFPLAHFLFAGPPSPRPPLFHFDFRLFYVPFEKGFFFQFPSSPIFFPLDLPLLGRPGTLFLLWQRHAPPLRADKTHDFSSPSRDQDTPQPGGFSRRRCAQVFLPFSLTVLIERPVFNVYTQEVFFPPARGQWGAQRVQEARVDSRRALPSVFCRSFLWESRVSAINFFFPR